ncbi:hypothetical protein, partial [Paenibacillus xylanexedens]|uniref:hypothetical protein n=1 Tax=Paenibacillus xylanexedens TaxID=528191 RepID=UPI0028EBBF8A
LFHLREEKMFLAKSNMEKMKDVVSDGYAYLEQIDVGEKEGQYPLESVEEYKTVLADAELLITKEGAEPSHFEVQTTELNNALKKLMESKVQPTQQTNPKPDTPTSREVSLRGTPSQLKGSHTLHFENSVVNFVNGKAQLPNELADKLAQVGYVE